MWPKQTVAAGLSCRCFSSQRLLDPVRAINELAEAREHSKGSATFLDLPDDVCRWWRMNKGQSLLVRDCYHPMFNKVLDDNKAKESDTISGSVVLGNPGIGKTGFLWWSLWKLLRNGQNIIIKLPASKRYACVKTVRGGPWASLHDLLPDAIWECDERPWYLAERTIPEADWFLPCKFLLTCSPLKRNYFEFAKAGSVEITFDPVWTESELLALNDRNFNHPPEDVKSRYLRWGGIPRYVLQKVSRGSQNELDRAIGGVRDADQIMKLQGLPEDQSHRVFHMKVDTSDYSTYNLVLASSYVRDKVYAEMPLPSLKRFITTPQEGAVRDIQGKLFEKFVLDMIIPKGGKLRFRELQKDGTFGPEQEEELPGLKSIYRLPGSKSGAVFPTEPLEDDGSMAVFEPLSAENPEWDFLAHGSVFQVTVTSLRALQLGDSTRAALEFLRSFPGQKDKRITFCILVPEFNFSKFAVDWFETVKPEKGTKRRSKEALPLILSQVMTALEELEVDIKLASITIGDVCPTCMGIIEKGNDLVPAILEGQKLAGGCL